MTLGETPEVGSLRMLFRRSPSRMTNSLFEVRPRSRGRSSAGLAFTLLRLGAFSTARSVDEGRRSSIACASATVTTCGVSASTRALSLLAVTVMLLSITPGDSTKSSV